MQVVSRVSLFKNQKTKLKKNSIRNRKKSTEIKNEEMIVKNYNELINDQIREYPVKSFIVDAYQYGYRIDYKSSRGHIDDFAKGLLGTVPKGVVVSALPLNLENAFVQIGTARIGRQSAFFDSVITAEKLEEQFKNVDPGTFICKPTQNQRVQMPELRKFFPWLTRFDEEEEEKNFFDRRFPNMKNIFQMDKTHYPNTRYLANLLVKNSENDQLKRVITKGNFNVKDVSSFVLDGSTPIGLSQYNIINTGNLVGKAIGLTPEDIVLTTVPLHLSSGLSLGVGMSLAHRAQLTYAYPEFNAQETLTSLAEEYATTLVILPSQLTVLLETESKKSPNTLKKVLVVSTPDDLPTSATLKKIKEKWPVETVSVVFGSQQTGGVISQSVNDLELKTLGELLPNTTAKIISNKLAIKGFNVENESDFVELNITAKLENNHLILSQ